MVACLSLTASAQNTRRGKTIIVPLPKDRSGLDVYPDCNRGKVCLPEAQYCAGRKNKVGSVEFQKKNYWYSWHSDEEVLKKARWNWFTARNYCRKHCMDLVSNPISVESQLPQYFVSLRSHSKARPSGTGSASLCEAPESKKSGLLAVCVTQR